MKIFEKSTHISLDSTEEQLQKALKKAGAYITARVATIVTGKKHRVTSPRRNRVVLLGMYHPVNIDTFNKVVDEHNKWLDSTNVDEFANKLIDLAKEYGKNKIIEFVSGLKA